MAERGTQPFLAILGLAAIYIALFHLADWAANHQAVSGVASLFFLPAVVRLAGYLVAGLWVVPALLLAGLCLVATGAYDLGPGHLAEVTVTIATAIGGPAATWFASRAVRLEPSLANLTPYRLFVLSASCAIGNGITLVSALLGFAAIDLDARIFVPIVMGDMIGTWITIYLIKLVAELWLSLRRR